MVQTARNLLREFITKWDDPIKRDEPINGADAVDALRDFHQIAKSVLRNEVRREREAKRRLAEGGCPNCQSRAFEALFDQIARGVLEGDGSLHFDLPSTELVLIRCKGCLRAFHLQDFNDIYWA